MRKLGTIAQVAALALAGIATAWAEVPRDVEDRIEARRDRRDEARIALPRTAAGTIDVPELITELRAAITRGSREIRFRDSTLSESEAARLRELAERFGFEGVRIREQGRRVRVDFRDRDHDELRERTGVRAERDKERNEARTARADNARPERTANADSIERTERPEKAERRERVERDGRPERPTRSGRH
jgi:hypothetical protein